jgi:hypothetical protein
MSATAFQRMRREQAELEAKKKQEELTQEEETNAAEGENESLTVKEVKVKLDELGVKYSHNTSEAKLREKLKNAIG